MVQIESLKCFLYLCSNGNNEWAIQMFSSFPVLLVPISTDNQVTPEVLCFRDCIYSLHYLTFLKPDGVSLLSLCRNLK